MSETNHSKPTGENQPLDAYIGRVADFALSQPDTQLGRDIGLILSEHLALKTIGTQLTRDKALLQYEADGMRRKIQDLTQTLTTLRFDMESLKQRNEALQAEVERLSSQIQPL